MSGLSMAIRLPIEFIVPPTTPTWLPPISMTVPHAAPSVNIVRPVPPRSAPPRAPAWRPSAAAMRQQPTTT